jgi:hypothetical protein
MGSTQSSVREEISSGSAATLLDVLYSDPEYRVTAGDLRAAAAAVAATAAGMDPSRSEAIFEALTAYCAAYASTYPKDTANHTVITFGDRTTIDGTSFNMHDGSIFAAGNCFSSLLQHRVGRFQEDSDPELFTAAFTTFCRPEKTTPAALVTFLQSFSPYVSGLSPSPSDRRDTIAHFICDKRYKFNPDLLDVVYLLGADLEAKGPDGGTPLKWAAQSGNVAAIERLAHWDVDFTASLPAHVSDQHLCIIDVFCVVSTLWQYPHMPTFT